MVPTSVHVLTICALYIIMCSALYDMKKKRPYVHNERKGLKGRNFKSEDLHTENMAIPEIQNSCNPNDGADRCQSNNCIYDHYDGVCLGRNEGCDRLSGRGKDECEYWRCYYCCKDDADLCFANKPSEECTTEKLGEITIYLDCPTHPSHKDFANLTIVAGTKCRNVPPGEAGNTNTGWRQGISGIAIKSGDCLVAFDKLNCRGESIRVDKPGTTFYCSGSVIHPWNDRTESFKWCW